jgi:hypothetical protein
MFERTPASDKPSLIGSDKQRLMLLKSERPPDKITIEEMRLDLAVRIGPYRLHASTSRSFVLYEGASAPVAVGKGQNGVPTFVRIESVGESSGFFLDLSTQFSNPPKFTSSFAGYIDLVLLPGEVLFATAFSIPGITKMTEIKVSEVLV